MHKETSKTGIRVTESSHIELDKNEELRFREDCFERVRTRLDQLRAVSATKRPKRQTPNPQPPRQPWMSGFPQCPHSAIVQNIRQDQRTQRRFGLPRPFEEVLYRTVLTYNGELNITLYVEANITFNDLPPPQSERRIPSAIRTHLRNYGMITDTSTTVDATDDAGHLLSFALGGGLEHTWNYVPQTIRLNRHLEISGTSAWRSTEDEIRNFLRDNRNGWVQWSLIVHYAPNNYNPNRPIGFCLHWISSDDNGILNDSRPEECFSNDPNSECHFDARDVDSGVPFLEFQWSLP